MIESHILNNNPQLSCLKEKLSLCVPGNSDTGRYYRAEMRFSFGDMHCALSLLFWCRSPNESQFRPCHCQCPRLVLLPDERLQAVCPTSSVAVGGRSSGQHWSLALAAALLFGEVGVGADGFSHEQVWSWTRTTMESSNQGPGRGLPCP